MGAGAGEKTAPRAGQTGRSLPPAGGDIGALEGGSAPPAPTRARGWLTADLDGEGRAEASPRPGRTLGGLGPFAATTENAAKILRSRPKGRRPHVYGV